MSDMNFEIARFNMLEQQIRPWEVLDQNSLHLMQQIPREEFVPKSYKNVAFSDTELPLKHKQFMLAPKIEAKILQAVQIEKTNNILEIGTGSGYLTALLACQANSVHSIDIYQDFIDLAKEKIACLGIENISFEQADMYSYNYGDKKYDVIVVGGSVASVAEELKQALTIDGRLFVICGQSPVMLAKLFTRVAQNQWMEEILFETEISALHNINEKKSFVF